MYEYKQKPTQAHQYPKAPAPRMQALVPQQPLSLHPVVNQAPIEQCAGCSGLGTAPVPNGQQGRPWWFWAAVGGGLGVGLYYLNKSGMTRNPEGAHLSDMEIAQEAAAVAVQAGEPVILWGPPGIGKTTWIESLGKAMGAKVFTVIGSTKDPADIGGMMNIDGSLIPPSWAKEIEQRSLKGQRSLLFLDEFSSMSPLVHAALLRVVRDKVAGDLDFDPKFAPLQGRAVHVVTAANRAGEGAGSVDLPPPAANRLIHIDWPEPPGVFYALGLILGWSKPKLVSLPKGWRDSEAAMSAKEDIAQFLRVRPDFLLAFPKSEKERGESWPSPRSWEMAAIVLGAARAAGVPLDVQTELMKGTVGDGPALELMAWTKERNIPDPELLLSDPESWDVPIDRRDIILAANQGVVAALYRNFSVDRWKAAFDYVDYMLQKGVSKDDMAVLVFDLMKIKKEQPDLANERMPKSVLRQFMEFLKSTGVLKGGKRRAGGRRVSAK